jgi:hypothetical protein
LPQKPLGFLAPTNVDGSTHVKRAQAKVELHENRLGFQLRAVRNEAPNIMMMMMMMVVVMILLCWAGMILLLSPAGSSPHIDAAAVQSGPKR